MRQHKIKSQETFYNGELYKPLAQRRQQLSQVMLEHLIEFSDAREERRSAVKSERLKELIRIVGGIPTLEGEFNECCLIGIWNPNGAIEWFCTCVLIHSRIVLSAAHCIEHGAAYVVALNTNNQNNLHNAGIINVRKALVHPQYSAARKLNDLAVLVLLVPSNTPPMSLASTREIAATREVELVRFGNDDVVSIKWFGIKRKVSVDIVSIHRNKNEDLNAEKARHGYESDLEFVAGGQGFDTCNGGSGGPVYIMKSEGRVVAGRTSRATTNSVNTCGDGGIYTRVDVNTRFIQSVIKNL